MSDSTKVKRPVNEFTEKKLLYLFNRRVRRNFHRETRENREQRKECLQEDLTAKHAKTANKKGSVRYRLGE